MVFPHVCAHFGIRGRCGIILPRLRGQLQNRTALIETNIPNMCQLHHPISMATEFFSILVADDKLHYESINIIDLRLASTAADLIPFSRLIPSWM